jgi:hypothetical protein
LSRRASNSCSAVLFCNGKSLTISEGVRVAAGLSVCQPVPSGPQNNFLLQVCEKIVSLLELACFAKNLKRARKDLTRRF